MADEDEFLELGVEELFDDENAWTIIEWADKFPALIPSETLWIEFQLEPDENLRRLVLRCPNLTILKRLELC